MRFRNQFARGQKTIGSYLKERLKLYYVVRDSIVSWLVLWAMNPPVSVGPSLSYLLVFSVCLVRATLPFHGRKFLSLRSFCFFFKYTYLYIVSVEEPSLSKLELFDAELQSVEVKLSW